ncbi:Ank2, partial [Symbiodinium necroappetens]
MDLFIPDYPIRTKETDLEAPVFSPIAPGLPDQRLDQLDLQANFRDPKEITVSRSSEVIAEDRRVDEAYFTKTELSQIGQDYPEETSPPNLPEIFHQEDEASEIQRAIFPDSYD